MQYGDAHNDQDRDIHHDPKEIVIIIKIEMMITSKQVVIEPASPVDDVVPGEGEAARTFEGGFFSVST